MTTNSLNVFEFLKSHPGEEMTKQAIAAELCLSVPAVTGSINAMIKKGLATDRTEEVVIEEGKKPKTVHYHMLTDEGLAYDPVAAEEAAKEAKARAKEAAKTKA
jgi:hypothetical protein